MIGYGAISIAFAGLAIVLVIRRETGILKRLRATPLPARPTSRRCCRPSWPPSRSRSSGSSCSDACSSGSPLLTGSARWCSRCCSARSRSAASGSASTALIRSAEGASAVVNAIYLPAAFIAGAFFSPRHFPSVLRGIADVLPLTYFLRLMRNVMLHGQAIWTQGTNVAVIAAWGSAGA